MSRALAPAWGAASMAFGGGPCHRRANRRDRRMSKAPPAGRRVHAAARADAAVLRCVAFAVFQAEFFPFAPVDARLARVGRRGPRDEQGAARGGDGCDDQKQLSCLHGFWCAPLIAAAGLPESLACTALYELRFEAGACCSCWIMLGSCCARRRGCCCKKKAIAD